MPYIRSDMADIRVNVDGVPYGGPWYSVEGGTLEIDASKTRPGAMGQEVSLGGPGSRSDLTATIQMSDIVTGWHRTLERKSVEAAPVKVSYTFLNRVGAPQGATHVVTGTLMTAQLPDMDADTADAAMYTLVVSCDEQGG